MKIYLSIILFLIPLSTFGKDRYHFSKLSLESGLSQITVTCIHEDKKGFMWFGTRNGLNRFDGYRFDVYTTDLENNTSISDNHVQCVAEDAEGNLWVGTSNGLNRLDKGTEKFKRYFYDSANPASLSNNTITAIYFDTNNNLWIGTRDGLNLYNKATNSFDRIAIDNLLINNPVNAIVRKDDILYIGTFSQGLIAYNIADKQYKVYKNNPDDMKSLSHNHIRAIAIDRNGNLWVGTYHDGVNLLRKGENSFSFYNTKNGLTDDYVRCIAESPQGEILVGTFNGLNSIDPKTGEITQYKTYGSNEGDLSHYSIQSIYFDRSQTLWVGTYAGGINYYSRFGQKFRFLIRVPT